jgi:hypothetical protein
MADGSVKPPVFSGKPDDDADGFVRAFDRYIKYREITDNGKKLNLFAVLLKDNAADWYDALSEVSKDTFEHLNKAFAARYQSPDSLKYKCANDLFTKKQAETESVDEYITRLRKLARLIGADDRILTFAVINGLKPYLSAQVLQSNPDSADKILEVARLAELAMPKMALMASESVICQRLAEMQTDMHRLSTKVDKAMTTSIESRSPTPERRVRFARSASPESPRHEAPTASYRSRQRGFQRDAYNEEQRGEAQHTGPCTRCARNLGKNAFCPARDPRKVCYYCRKPGHFQAACLSAPRQY